MSTARVGIDLDLMNGDQVFNEIKQIERALKSLSGGKHRLDIKSNVSKLRDELEALKAEKATIRINTREADARIAKLKKSIAQLNKILNTKTNLRGRPMNPGQLRKVQAALKGLNNELRQTQSRKLNLGNEFRRVSVEAQAARQQIDAMNRALANVKPLKEYFNSATAKASHLGSALQSLGSAVNRMAQPTRMLLNGTLFAAGYKLMNLASEGLSSGLSRYDTMKKYPMMMQEYSKASYTAQKSIHDLDMAVRGLPTGLDEIVQIAQRYTLSLGDMKRGTQLAIATNNAFLASMATESQKYQGMLQLQDLMNGKKLNSREWMSLGASMGKAINEIGKEFGYTNENMGEFRQQLYGGKIDSQEFLDALVKVGTGTGKVAKMAELSKQTWEAFTANIRNAFSRMTAGVVESLDEVVNVMTGGKYKSVNTYLADKLIPQIDKMTASAKKWIKANPDFFIDTFNRLKNLDWKGFAKGFGEGIKTMVDFGLKLAELGSKFGAENIGKFMAMAGMISNIFTIVGGLIRGGRFIPGMSVVGLVAIARLLKGFGLFEGAGGKIKGLFRNITGIGKEATKAEKATKGGKALGSIKGNLAKWIKPLAGIGSVLAVIAATAGTIMVSVKAIKEAIKDMGEISSDFYAVDWGVMAKVATGFGTFVGAFVGLGKLASKNLRVSGMTALGTAIAGGITAMVAGFGRLDVKLVKDSIKDMVTITNDAKKLGENITALKGTKFDKDSAKNLAEQIYGVYEAMFNRGDRSLSQIKKRDVKKAQDAINSVKGIFDTLKSIADTLPSLYASLNKAGVQGAETKGRGANPFSNFQVQIQSLFTGINGIMTSLNTDLLGEGQFSAKAMSKFNEVMASVKGTFDSISGLVAKLPKIYESLNKMGLGGKAVSGGQKQGGGTQFDSLVSGVSSLFKGVGDMYKQISVSIDSGGFDVTKLSEKLESVAQGVESIKKIANRLNALGSKGGSLFNVKGGAFTAIGNIKKLIGKLKSALGDADLGGLKSQIDTFVSSIKSMLGQLKALGENGTNTVEVSVTIKGTVRGQKAVVTKINKAIAQIKAACKPRKFTKHVYINITRHVSVGGDSIPSASSLGGGGSRGGGGRGTVDSHNPHTGGYIGGQRVLYRAKGGSIFKPKGTDVVPAMLTQGEYVQKKSAVDFWGVRFMQKINNLDVNGALRELSTKATHYMNVNRGTTINNNTTNNNNMTQNVYTSNPNFAYKRSNRYVMAL